MATDTVLITHVTGKAWMRTSDGTMVALHEGMRVPVNAQIVTGEGASVTLQANGVPPVIVGQNTDMLVTDDLAAAQPQPAEHAVDTLAAHVADQVLAALESGRDPFDVIDPTTAVLTGGSGGGGASFVRLSSVIETSSPLSLTYPRLGSAEAPEFVPFNGVAARDEDPAGPTINVGNDPDGNSGGPDVLPSAFYIQEDDTIAGVPGSFAFTASAGLGSLQFAFSPETGQTGTLTVSLADLDRLSASGSTPIVIDTETGLLTLTGYDPVAGTVSYIYQSDAPLNHPLARDALPDDIKIMVSDSLGRTASADLIALIVDDVPVARADTDSLAVGQYTAETGNVITGVGTTNTNASGVDTQGAD
ncbi:MAG: retention module-containing protein, partial [Castellaniella sp.]|uniref:retention module-containing protein n=1 Tax=Castellaniella sp. TaxID=1955812 RepID=UPI003A840767